MALAVKPASVTFTFYDSNGQILYDKQHDVDGARDLPNYQRDCTLQVYDTVNAVKYLGTVSDVETYTEIDANNLVYITYVRCKDSHSA